MGFIINPYMVAAGGFDNTYSVDFDGVDDYVKLGTPISGSGDKTLSMWIKPNTIVANDRIFSNWLNNGIAMSIQFGSSTIQIYAGTSGWQDITSALPSTGSWSHLAIVWSGTSLGGGGTVTGYLNGGSSSTATLPSNIQGGQAATWSDVGLAARLWAAYGNEYDGNIDEVACWGSAFTSGQVSTLYNSGTPTDLTSLSPVGWWRMGDGDVFPTLTDHGSGSNNGTMTNMVAGDIVADVPT